MIHTAFELWLLEMICKNDLRSTNFRRSAGWVAAQINVPCVPPHEWRRRKAVIAGLIERGLLELTPYGVGLNVAHITSADLISRVDRKILDGHVPFSFDVTLKGAAIWESFAQPDWSNYWEYTNLRTFVSESFASVADDQPELFLIQAGSARMPEERVTLQLSSSLEFSTAEFLYRESIREWHVRNWKTVENACFALVCFRGPRPDHVDPNRRTLRHSTPWLRRGLGGIVRNV